MTELHNARALRTTGGHRVPAAAKERTAATLRSTIGLAGSPSDAERSRTLLATAQSASLATMSVDHLGFPFGSLVAFAQDGEGNPLLCLSDIAEHSRNVAADRRGSLMVTAGGGADADPLALGRVTLLGEIDALDGDARVEALDRYLAAHPHAFYSSFHDFRLYRLDVHSVRYVGGFGRMSWVGQAEYAAAEPDSLIPHSGRIIEHMNTDHSDALVAYCIAFGNAPGTMSATLVGVDRYGLDIMAHLADDGRSAVRIGFAAPADSPQSVRTAVVELLRDARSRLA